MTTRDYLTCGIFVAVLCVSSVLTIPLFFTPIPITLQVLAIGIVSATLGGKKAALTVLVYILLGCIGLPVFSGMKGGIGVLAGATGGYIWGFAPFALISGTLIEKAEQRFSNRTLAIVSLLILEASFLIVYACGTMQLMNVANLNLSQALASAVLPFVPLDIIKLAAAVYISVYLKKALKYS